LRLSVPLDFAILDNHGKPMRVVAVSPEEHHELAEVSQRIVARTWDRLQDYYAEAAFSPNEISAFVEDLGLIATEHNNPALKPRLRALIDLCQEAIRLNRGIAVLPD
jgi:hypothetical protein